MTDAEMTEGWVPGDERRRDEEIAAQVLDVVEGDFSWYWTTEAVEITPP